MEKCSQCGSKVINKKGISKAGNPYNGNFCSNKECDYKEWLEAEAQPDRHEELMKGLRDIWTKIDGLETKIDRICQEKPEEEMDKEDQEQ